MPSPYVKSLSKETGKSVAEIEKLWDKAKEISSDTFGKPESDFGAKEYKYTVGIVKNMLGINENILDPSFFLKSGKSARDFIRETVVSANFSIGDENPVVNKNKDEDGEGDAAEITMGNFPDKGGDLDEQTEIPQGSADVGSVMTDLSSNAREDEILLPSEDYYEDFDDYEDPQRIDNAE